MRFARVTRHIWQLANAAWSSLVHLLPFNSGTGAIEYRTLRDYARRYTLYADCPGCRRHVVLNPMQTAKVTGWDVTCSACGHRGAELRVVSDGAPDCGR